MVLKDGYEFKFYKMLNNGVRRWTCCKSIHVSISFKSAENGDNTEIFNDHNHNKPRGQDINRQKLNEYLKRKAVEEISALPSKLIFG